MLGGAALGSGVLGWRLYDWHVNQAADLAARGAGELLARTELYPRRGTIYDISGDVLAIERSASRVVADPSVVHEERSAFDVANRLGDILEPRSHSARQRDQQPSVPLCAVGDRRCGRHARAIARRRGGPTSSRVSGSSRTGCACIPTAASALMCSAFLGERVDRPGDIVGQAGVEAHYDDLLSGSPGLRTSDLDRLGREIPIGRHNLLPARHGSHLTLTLNRTIQHIVEEELEIAVERFSAASGSVIMLDPRTGSILALANVPDYDPARVHEYQSFGPEFANRALSHVYEPGSTFKLITMAAGLDSKAVTPTSTHDLPGSIRYFGEEFKNWDLQTYPEQNMTSVLRHSSNTGAIFVADKTGADRFYTYLDKFGFGELTGVDTSGEVPGILRRRGDRAWFPADLAANSFGHGIGVTALQIAAAIGAIANDGTLMRPHIVRSVEHPDGRQGFVQPQEVQQVISPETSRQLIQMVESAEGGIVNNPALIPGYRTAGKTGTAEIPLGGRFQADLSVASYVGFGPLEDPRVLTLVVINRPQKGFFGAYVASPTFQRIMTRVFSYLRVPARAA